MVPLIAGSLIGGALADAYDRRKLLLVAQVLVGSTSVGLALNAMLAAPQGVADLRAGGGPAGLRRAGLAHPQRGHAQAGRAPTTCRPPAALNQLMYQLGVVVGPAVGGLLIAKVSLASAYWVDAVTFGFAIVALLAMKPMRPEGGGTKASAASIVEGLRFLKGRQALQGTFVIDINAMVFGMPRALFPAIGTSLGGPAVVGLLYAAPGAGALVGAATSGWVTRVDRQGRATIIAVIAWGASIAAFGLTHGCRWPWPAGRGRRGRCHLGRVPQHDPAAERARPACGAGCRRSTSPWSPAARAWATSSPARSRR